MEESLCEVLKYQSQPFSRDEWHIDSGGMDFQPVLRKVGEFGKFQKIQFFCLCLAASFVCVFSNFSLFFFLYTPAHWCKNSSAEVVSFVKTQNIHNQSMWNCRVMIDPEVEPLNDTECPDGWDHDKSRMSTTIATKWNLYCSSSDTKEWIITVTQVGTIFGIFIFSHVQDLYGRRPAFFACLTLYIVTAASSVLIENLTYFVMLRIINKMTAVPAFQIPYIMAVELVGPNQRTMITSIMAIVFSLVVSLLCLIAYLCSDILIFGLVTSLPLVVFYGYWWILCESPRWLMMQNDFEKLETLVFHMAKINGRDLPENFKMLDVLVESQQEPMDPASPQQSTFIPTPSSTYPSTGIQFWHLWKTTNLRCKTIVLTYLWTTNSIVYYGLQYSTMSVSMTVESFKMYMILSLVEIPAACMNWMILDRVGRVIPSSLTMLVAGFAATASFFFFYPSPSIPALTSLVAATKFCIASSYSIIYQQSAEMYPTEARAMGIGTSALFGNIGSLVMPYIVSSWRTLMMLPMLVLGGISIFGSLAAMFLPETLQQTLPDSLTDAESRGLVGVGSFKENVTGQLYDSEEMD